MIHRLPISPARTGVRSVVPLVVLLLTVAGCERPSSGNSNGEEATSTESDANPGSARTTVVEVVSLKQGRVEDSITLSGDLKAEQRADLTSQISGVVVTVHVKEGTAVVRDQLLVELDKEQLELTAREKALAHQDSTERAKTSLLEEKEAGQNESSRKLAFDKAEREYRRIESIVATTGTNPLSEEEVETKRFARDEAKIAYETASVAKERSEISAKLAAIVVEQARAAWDSALLQVKRADIRAPFDGVVSFVEIRPGELVQVGARVAEVVNPTQLYTEVRVPQRRLAVLEMGRPVELTPETMPGATFSGAVEAIHPTVDPEQGTVKVRVKVSDVDGVLRPGIYVSARIILTRDDSAWLIPKECRLLEGGESIAYVVRDDLAVRVVLEEGLQTTHEVQVIPSDDGLRSDDRVIIRGQNHVRPGSRVRIEGESQPSAESATARASDDAATKKG